MTTVIKPKRSEVASSIPDSSQLQIGELAINITDGKFFTKTSSNIVKEIGGAGAITLQGVTNNSGVTTNDITFNNSNVVFEAQSPIFKTYLYMTTPATKVNTLLLPDESGTLATVADSLAYSIVFG